MRLNGEDNAASKLSGHNFVLAHVNLHYKRAEPLWVEHLHCSHPTTIPETGGLKFVSDNASGLQSLYINLN